MSLRSSAHLLCMKRNAQLASILTATLLTPVAIGLAALPAQAAPASTSAAASAVASAITVNATAPGTLTIAGHRGLPVTVWTKGTKAITKRPATTSAITFIGLLGGRAYDVYIGDAKAVRVLTAKTPTPATALTITAGPIDGSLNVVWQIPLPASVKAADVSYRVVATSPTASTVDLTVRGTDHALLTGLGPKSAYAITVTATSGVGTNARTVGSANQQMTTTVADTPSAAVVTPKPVVVETVVAKPAVTTPVPTAAPASSSSGSSSSAPSAPRTRTVYLCPAGFSDAGDLCQQTTAYTFHDVTTTSPYTYHQEFVKTGAHFVGVNRQWDGACVGGTDYGSTCGYWQDDGYNVSVKDAPPTGFSDDGSQYSKTDSVKDDLPSGFSDDGSQWVKTAAKVATEVPA